MPILAALLISLLSSVFTALGTYFTKKVAATLAIIALVGAAALTMWGAVKGAIAALSFVAPTWLGAALTWVIPSNLSTAIGLAFSIEVAISAYRWFKQTMLANE